MRLHVLGVRGSRPTPGPDHVRYGGNTSCIALAHDGEAPSLVLDAGTGLTSLTKVLGGGDFHGSILLSHLHWDHVYGLPFFSAGDRPGARVDLWMPAQGDAEQVLTDVMSPPHFPITPRQLRGTWHIGGLEPGTTTIEGFQVTAVEIPHKGGRTFGYRVSDAASTVVYMPDHGPCALGDGDDGHGLLHEAAIELAQGADLLFHDAQHTIPEFPAVRHFGHSVIEYAVSLGRVAGVAKVMLFHHDPGRTDAQLDEIAAAMSATYGDPIVVEVAREGSILDL